MGISGDAHKLQRDFGVPCAGLICLSDEANVRLCSSANGRAPQKWSLAGMQSLHHLQLNCHVYGSSYTSCRLLFFHHVCCACCQLHDLNHAEKICFISASDRPQQITAEWSDLNIKSSCCMPYKPCRCSQQDLHPRSREAESIVLANMTIKAVH